MGDHNPEPWEWRAYRRATGRAVPAAWRRTRRARAGYALLSVALLCTAAADLFFFDLSAVAGPLALVGAAIWALLRATEGLRRLPAEGLVACPRCGVPTALLMDPDGRAVIACRACNLARPFGPDAGAATGRASAPANAGKGRRDATGDPY